MQFDKKNLSFKFTTFPFWYINFGVFTSATKQVCNF